MTVTVAQHAVRALSLLGVAVVQKGGSVNYDDRIVGTEWVMYAEDGVPPYQRRKIAGWAPSFDDKAVLFVIDVWTKKIETIMSDEWEEWVARGATQIKK